MSLENLNNDRIVTILSVDIGTTFVKCFIFGLDLNVLYKESRKLNIIQPQDGHFELDPNELLDLVKDLLRNAIAFAKSKNYYVKTLGIATQRNSVLIWNKETSEPYTNFILWNDTRNSSEVDKMNRTVTLNAVKTGAWLLSSAINSHRFRSFSSYEYSTDHVSMKLSWLLANTTKKIDYKNTLYGCIETWILWNLTKDKIHATDMTCVGCTGFYDIFIDQWSFIMCKITGIPMNILPTPYDTSYNYGLIDKNLIGADEDLSITAVIGDAQSSLITECAFEIGDIVITVGTGAFLSVNTGSKPLSSSYEAFPLVGYQYLKDKFYILHVGVHTAGIAIEWAKSIGLFDKYEEIDQILNATNNSNGVYFVPAFGAIKVNHEDTRCAAGFVGLRSNTTKAHLFRAIIDSVAFTIKEKFDALLKDLKIHNIKVNSVRICGGVSRSNFLCQYLANLINYPIERSDTCQHSSSLGVAIAAGIGASIWIKKEDLIKYRKNIEVFKPLDDNNNENINENQLITNNDHISKINNRFESNQNDLNKWNDAIKRLMKWKNL